MMSWLIPLAAKSFLIAGGALLLLKLMKNRSAADRSWIAHLALAGLLLLPVATVALPTLDIAGPEFLVGKADVQSPGTAPAPAPVHATAVRASPAPEAGEPSVGSAAVNWPFWGYAIPSALLVLLTLIALARLFILKAQAKVLVDAPWLTALARAQQRMGFKHGTALLTSDALPSPISWGVVRPVILLNAEAADSHDEAEAIITHELAHVANLDWAKLMVSRIATALFWFNPFVWLLAREAHQLREEAADDAVLSTDIQDTDYARLLVGVARHECRGFLLGAHGVAPAKNSLARRVKRVLDGAAKRAPGGWRWGSAAAFFAAGMAVPVAALNLVPATTPAEESGSYYPVAKGDPTLADQIAQATGGAVSGAVSGAVAGAVEGATMTAANGATIVTKDGVTVLRNPSGATVTVYAADKKGRRKVVMVGPNGQTMTFADARTVPGLAGMAVPPRPPHPPRPPRTELDTAIEMKAVGVTPEYAAQMRQAFPGARLTSDDLIELRSLQVTPDYLRALAASGYRGLDVDAVVEAKAIGLSPDYIRAMAEAGYSRLSMDDLSGLRAVGVTPDYIRSLASVGYSRLSADELQELRALNVTAKYIQKLKARGYSLPIDKIVEMKAIGVEPEDIQKDDGG
jgi:beta-lactamase regulating signal transducer with metallopeptidase domain